MALRVGIAVGGDHVRAITVRGGRVVSATEAELPAGASLAEVVADALASAPLPRFPAPRVTVALGPSLAQTRRLTGLPPVDDRRLLAQMVREGASKFFLRTGAPLLTTGVRAESPGVVWAGALHEPATRAAEAGCRAAGVTVDAFVPAVVALAHGLADGTHAWSDGSAAVEVEVAGGTLTSVRRILPGVPAAELPVPVAALVPLGEHAWRFADAYGAAVLPRDEPLAVRRGEGGRRRTDVPPWRLGIAATAAALSLAGAAIAPAWRAMSAEEVAAARLARHQSAYRAASVARGDAARVTAALVEVAAFDAARRSPTLFLAELTRALPEGSALVAVRVDSAGGNLVALAPRAAGVLVPLERMAGVDGPEIVGPVTQETVAGQAVERVSVRFRWAKPRAGGGRP
ncbi:MAG TPA: hypothetical protein VE913_17480 [Longimicrobium sp.]|nr:hypothetical protein [Longimicrobium sp.]